MSATNKGFKWTPEKQNDLIELRKQGRTMVHIAKVLNVPHYAVKCRIAFLKLPLAPKEIREPKTKAVVSRAVKVQDFFAGKLITKFGIHDINPKQLAYYCRMSTIVRNLTHSVTRENCADYIGITKQNKIIVLGNFAEKLIQENLPLIAPQNPDAIEYIMESCWDYPSQRNIAE